MRRGWRTRGAVAVLCLGLAGSLGAALPEDIKALLNEKKTEQALARAYELLPELPGSQRVELARLAFDTDPDLGRLKEALRRAAEWDGDEMARQGICRLYAQLCLLQRDYQNAQWAYDQLRSDPDAVLSSAGLLFLLGKGGEAKERLSSLAADTKNADLQEKALVLQAWVWWSEGQAKAAYELLAKKQSPAALYLVSILARAQGLKAEDRAARDALAKKWPKSVWAGLAEPDSDPGLQIDTTVLILSGLGVIAAGDQMPALTQTSAKPPANEDSPARAVQVGYFRDNNYARAMAAKLQGKGYTVQIEEEKASKGYKVLVAIKPGQDSEKLVVELKELGFEGVLVF